MGGKKSSLTRMTIPVPKRKGHMTLADLYSLYLVKGIVSVCEDGKVVLQGKEKSAYSA
jgi:hypothetical protein